MEQSQQRRSVGKVSFGILVILVTAALVGQKVQVFQIVGGIIIAYMGFDMLAGRHTVGRQPPSEGVGDTAVTLAPLLSLLPGPGQSRPW